MLKFGICPAHAPVIRTHKCQSILKMAILVSVMYYQTQRRGKWSWARVPVEDESPFLLLFIYFHNGRGPNVSSGKQLSALPLFITITGLSYYGWLVLFQILLSRVQTMNSELQLLPSSQQFNLVVTRITRVYTTFHSNTIRFGTFTF